jgi:hypothetical protein
MPLARRASYRIETIFSKSFARTWSINSTPAEIRSRLTRRLAHFLFVTQDCEARQSLSRRETRGDDGARIFTFREDNVLRLRSCALTNLIEDGHVFYLCLSAKSNRLVISTTSFVAARMHAATDLIITPDGSRMTLVRRQAAALQISTRGQRCESHNSKAA